ncbi:hypothetical protein BGX23_010948 [Mortierella sp. AD031]|nr:hypothetical protein BGX23_010948 [Mortierella sp. AD031]
MSPNFDNPSVRVASIAELAALIGTHLSQQDRLSCIKVSQGWHQGFIPVLYQEMDDRKGAWPRILKSHDRPDTNNGQDLVWIRNLFQKYGSHIRSLTTQWRVIVDAAYLGQACTQIQSLSTYDISSYTIKELGEYEEIRDEGELTYEDRMEPAMTGQLLSPDFATAFKPMFAGWRTLEQQEADWYTCQHFWLLLRQNPQLTHLRLDWNLKELFEVTPEFFYTTMAGLPRLKYLENRSDTVDLTVLLDCCPRLQAYTSYSITDEEKLVQRMSPSMRSLELGMAVHSKAFLTLLKNLPNLRHLKLNRFQYEEEHCTDVGKVLEGRPSGLRTLSVQSGSRDWDQWIGQLLLPWLPDLIELSVSELEPETAKGLGLHCKGLQIYSQSSATESIHEYYGPQTASNVFSDLLESCPDLRVLDGIRHKIDAERFGQVKEWVACSNLEKLCCQFVGFSRLDALEEDTLEKATAMNGRQEPGDSILELKERQRVGREQQRVAYNHLSTLTRLRVLDCGYEFRDPYTMQYIRRNRENDNGMHHGFNKPIANTMELTLESGLGHLSSLIDLEVFGFEGVDHRIGKSELEWMAVSWPKLKVMRGLHEDALLEKEGRAERAALREYMQILRPDVKHQPSKYLSLSAMPDFLALQTFLRLPEMISALGSQLELPDLLSGIQVSRFWYDAMLPRLWCSIDDTKDAFPRILSLHDSEEAQGDKDEAWVLAIFAKHGHLIRHLTTQTRIIVKAVSVSGTCTNLLTLTTESLIYGLTLKDKDIQSGMDDLNRNYHESQDQAQGGPLISPMFEGAIRPGAPGARTMEHQDRDWYVAQHFWLIIYNNLSLRRLRLDWSLEELFRIKSPAFVYNMLERLRNLEWLDILVEHVPTLRFLQTNKSFRAYGEFRKQFSCLRVLKVNSNVPLRDVFYYFRHLPCLEELMLSGPRESIPACGVDDVKSFLHLPITPNPLRMLQIAMPLGSLDEPFSSLLLPWLPQLSEFRACVLQPATARGLVAHCPKLQVFCQFGHDIYETICAKYTPDSYSSSELNTLLEGCPHLKIIDAIHHKVPADRLLPGQWACQGLEFLRRQIVGIERLTSEEQQLLNKMSMSDSAAAPTTSKERMVMEKQLRGREQQRRVFQKIAGLERLKTCDLGYEYREVDLHRWRHNWKERLYTIDEKECLWYSGPIADTLELSLEPGLEQLATLRDLEVFGFEGVDHRIGRREMDWMAANWPRLRILRGLHEDTLPMAEPDTHRAELREIMHAIRP